MGAGRGLGALRGSSHPTECAGPTSNPRVLQDLGEERTWLLPNPSCSLPNPVSLQENFELNHETLYLAVKLVDHYLVEVVSMKDKLQLIGSTAVLIASKFEVTPGLGTVLRGWGCLGEFWDREELTEGGASILVLLLPIPGAADLPLFHCRSNGDTGVQPGWTLGWSRQEKCPWRARKSCGGTPVGSG